MKKIKKTLLALVAALIIISSIAPSFIYASELHDSENSVSSKTYNKLSSEVNMIYRHLIKYDHSKNKFVVDEYKTEQYYNYNDESIKGVYLMKDSLNDELINTGSTNYSEIINQKLSEIEYVLQGNDINNLIPKNTRMKRALDFSWIQRCLKEAWGTAVSLVTLKGIVNLVKAGKFEVAAAKLAASTAGKIVGIAALFAFLATCGATTVS